jgi:biotin carboxyl carrier protein
MTQPLELLLERVGERLVLKSPGVGLFTRALPAGALVSPHASAGVLNALGRRFELVAPEGALGRVVNAPPERVQAPVGYGTVLYELAPLDSGALATPQVRAAAGARAGALVFRAPHSGRFWQRPSPNDPPFLRPGDALADGQTIGLIEVMKTFTHLVYRSGGELPARAKLVRFLAADGAEVKDGGELLELERG